MKLAPSLRSAVLGVCMFALVGVVAFRWWPEGQAVTSQARPPGLFDRYDRDGNGVARLDEVAEVDRERFESLLEMAGQTELAALTRAQFERALHAPRQIVTEPAGENSSEVLPEAEANDLANAKDGKIEADLATETIASADVHDSFASLDTDGDGMLSRDEFAEFFETLPTSARIETRSASAMTDQAAVAGDASSTVLLAAEIIADAQPMPPTSVTLVPVEDVVIGFLPKRLFQKLDGNRDGALSKTEIPRSHVARLMRGDTDSDGRLSLGEFAAIFGHQGGNVKKASSNHRTTRRRRGGLITRPASGEKVPVYDPTQNEPRSEAEVPSWFHQRDLNRDHQVAQSEWPAMALAEFRRVDANDDGFISRTEAATQGRTGERKTTP